MHRRHGFTLIELLVVIVIIGLLAAIAASFMWQSKENGFRATLQSDLRVLLTHQESYFSDNYRYAAVTGDMPAFRASPGVTVTVVAADEGGWSAQATHASYSGQCAMFMGSAAPVVPATTAGIVACN